MNSLFNHKDGDLDIACDDILKLINIHQDFLFSADNLKILAYVLWRWESLYNNARIVYSKHRNEQEEQCITSPKDELINGHIIYYKDISWYKIAKAALKTIASENYSSALENKIRTNEYFENLIQPVYDEWDILYWKKNKTLNEWIEFLSNSRHKNHALFQHNKNILNHIFCSSNSFKWNKEGYLDSSIKTSLFGDYMYSKKLLPSFISEPLNEILYREKCIYTNQKAWEIIEETNQIEIKKRLKSSNLYFDANLSDIEKYEIYLKDINQMVFNRGATNIVKKYSINHFSVILSAPKNLETSYVNEIINISFDVLKNKDLYDTTQINLIEKFVKKNPQWFRKRTIEKLLKIK